MTNLSGTNLNNGSAVGPQGEGRDSPSRFPAYPAYKDSGVKWLSDVPEHWDVRRNKQVFRLVSVQVGNKSADFQLLSLTLRGVIPRDMESGKGKFPAEFDTYQVVEPDDIVFCLFDIDETPRTVGISSDFGMITGAYTVAKTLPAADPRFIYYYYFSIDLRKGLRPFYTGLRKVVRPETFLNIELPLPPLSEQANICNFLDHETARIDALIEEQQRLIELLKEKRQAVISHAVTRGLDPSVPMKDSGVEWLGEVPAHWGLRPLKYQCRFSGGGTPSKENLEYWNGEIPWVSPKDMKKFWISDAEDKITEIAVRESSTNIVPPGALLMVVRSGILQRTLPVAINTAPVALNQDMKALRFEVEGMAEFVAFLIAGFEHSVLLAWRKQGATVESIEHEYLANAIIPIPPLAEVEEILNEIRVSEAKFDALARESASLIGGLQERRSALISAAVTGKIDVRGWQPPVSTPAPEPEVAEAV